MFSFLLAPLALVGAAFILVEDVKGRRHEVRKFVMKGDVQRKAALALLKKKESGK